MNFKEPKLKPRAKLELKLKLKFKLNCVWFGIVHWSPAVRIALYALQISSLTFYFHFISFFFSFFLFDFPFLPATTGKCIYACERACICLRRLLFYLCAYVCVCVWPTQVAGTVACLLATAFSMSLISWAYHLNCSVCSRLWVQFSEIDDSPGAIAFLFVVNNTQTHTHTPRQA